ncbi:integrase arm-type DNA-binding domain-containing protein [Alcaligenes faecalis subsp. phenolicus]|uniref:tyrosine-type recombinase/integrase n=1 Tax=Alcaligenes nematophilus TaxID=2994643 RepID=UPI002AA3F0EA|nr:integrase arm-type DNA-binding domain-containing protein [Alcaligenes phenolicus]
MAKIIPPLTDSQCKSAKYSPDGKNRLFDGGGLYLELLPSGAKRWRLKYRRPQSKAESRLTFGSYPEVSLAKARQMREEAKTELAENVDPGLTAIATAAHLPPSFEVVANEWLEVRKKSWSTGYFQRIRNALQANVYPVIGKMPIEAVTGKAVLKIIQTVEHRGALEMASRVLEAVGMVFRYACGVGFANNDVTHGLRQFLQERPPVQHYPHVDADDLPLLLKRIMQYHGRPETRYALQLMMRTFPRTNELRWARWEEFDMVNALWTIPAERMKGRLIQKQSAADHLVPLSRQSVQILESLRALSGRHSFLFPGVHNPRSTPISSETMNRALKIMGFGGLQTGHGFRGLASTIMNEQSGFRSEVIERQLAHRDRNKVRRAYNHAQYMAERHDLMQWWSDYLDEQLGKAPK